VLKLSTANVVCRVVNDENSCRWEESLRHVLLLNPEVVDCPWSFKSRLITADARETSDRFYVQVTELGG
jgi:hypothetical protein